LVASKAIDQTLRTILILARLSRSALACVSLPTAADERTASSSYLCDAPNKQRAALELGSSAERGIA
jgi:hypothetical protein